MTTDLEIYAQGDRTRLRQLTVLANAPNLVPDSHKTGGQIDWGAVVLSVHNAVRVGLDPVDNLRLFPVIKGTVFPMAEVWQVLARRHGWRVTVPVDTAERCVVHMVHTRTGETPPDFEITLEEARQLGAAKTNPNYRDGGARSMVRSRAIRTAIKLNAPEVMQDPVVADWGDDLELSGPAPVGEDASPGPENQRMVPARSVAPDGSTIPEYLREDEVDPEVRAGLIARLDALMGMSPETFAWLQDKANRCKMPNPRAHRFTVCHGELLSRWITEAADTIAIAEPTPPAVHDDALEAASHDDQSETYRYSPEDEAPF